MSSTVLYPYRNAIAQWVNTVTGLKAIWMEQAEVRPPRPYVAMKINTIKPMGIDSDFVQDNGTTTSTGPREFTLSMNIYGHDAIETMLTLQAALLWPSTAQTFDAVSLVFVNYSDVRDLTALLETRYESRSQMDILFRFKSISLDPNSGAIDSVSVTNSINGVTVTIP